jgi:N-acetylglucosamine kinase-like BadF-type ATPase
MTQVTPPYTALLAVDAGGTSTRSMVVDPSGRCLGYAVAGSGNPTAVGSPAAAASVAESAAEALRTADVPGGSIGLAVLAMAGQGGTTSAAAEVGRRLAELGIARPPVFDSDLLATYFSGTYRPDGYAVVAGTGAAAIRVEGGQQVAVADALGWLLGDEGSGFWIGQRVVRAVLADLDGRQPATALTPLLLQRLEVARAVGAGSRAAILAVVQRLYAAPPVRLADFAALVFEAAGDPTAEGIVRDAGDALAQTLAAVTEPSVSGPVVLGGGILSHGTALAERLARTSGAADVRTVVDGAVGAAVLTLRHAGVVLDAAGFDTLTESLGALRLVRR